MAYFILEVNEKPFKIIQARNEEEANEHAQKRDWARGKLHVRPMTGRSK